MTDFPLAGLESPVNYEEKCLCVLVLDTSGSMGGAPIKQLNEGMQQFKNDILADFVASQRLEICIVTFDSTIRCLQEPSLIQQTAMPHLTTSGSTKLVDGMRLAMQKVEERKQWYKATGQSYYRPFLVLITDGEPDANQDVVSLTQEIKLGFDAKQFIMWSVGVQGYNHAKLAQLCPPDYPPLPLDGLQFNKFFKWLSNSMGAVTKSSPGDTVSFAPVSVAQGGWAQMTIS